MRSTPSILAAALCIAIARGPAPAQPTPSCPGDCNLDGVVTIDELLRGVNFLLAGEPPAGCDELDDDRDGVVGVNEMIRAVIKALIGCRLTGEDAAEAAAGVAIGIVDSSAVIDLGSAAAGGPGSGGAALVTALGATGAVPGIAASGAGAGLAPPCAAGGSVEESCSSDRESSRLTITYRDCRTMLSDTLLLVLDGRLVRRVDDGRYCSTRQLRDGAQVREELTAFRQAVFERDVALLDFLGTYARDVIPAPNGCAGRSGSEKFDGALALRCDPATDSTVCPPAGRDLSLVARGLTVIRDSSGQIGDCTRTRTLLGRLEVSDRVSGRAFDAVYRQFVVADRVSLQQPPFQLQGAVAVDCLGEVSLGTEVPISRAANARCPASGLLFVRFPDQFEPAIRFLRSGVEIDLDGDGQADLGAPSCEAASLTQCS